ncbi:MAG: adenosylcobinamide-GDP ribazoletransferase [Bauldia sp.]|nr:adenosylcobinamide-GDP ribazoletransferase [Bauldia sp.]
MLRGEAEAAIEDLRTSTAFLTRLPPDWIGSPAQAMPDFRRAARVFPLVGALVGAVGGAVLLLAAWLHLPPLLAAGLAVLATVAFTGALHEDGLADTADGFGGAGSAQRRLEIMDDSRIGTFGVIAVVFSLLLRVAALTSLIALGPFRAALALVAAEALSRAAMVRFWESLPAAKPGGLASDTGPPDHQATVIALVLGFLITLGLVWPALGFWPAILAILLVSLATYMFARLSQDAIGGRTGDTLGACQQVALLAFLVGTTAA